jgi:hypothetical protein
LIRIEFTRRSPADGSDKSSSAPTTEAKPGISRERPLGSPPSLALRRARATSSPTIRPPRRPLLTSFTTARSIRGSSSGCGIWSRRSPIPTLSTPEWKTPPSSARLTAARTGKNSPASADTAPGPSGSPARVACACTPSFSTRATRSEFTLRSRRRAHSAPTTAAQAGSRSTAGFTRSTFRIPRLRLVTACTTSR